MPDEESNLYTRERSVTRIFLYGKLTALIVNKKTRYFRGRNLTTRAEVSATVLIAADTTGSNAVELLNQKIRLEEDPKSKSNRSRSLIQEWHLVTNVAPVRLRSYPRQNRIQQRAICVAIRIAGSSVREA